MEILFLFTFLFIIAQFFEKSDYDKEKEYKELPPFTKEEAENYYNQTFKNK